MFGHQSQLLLQVEILLLLQLLLPRLLCPIQLLAL